MSSEHDRKSATFRPIRMHHPMNGGSDCPSLPDSVSGSLEVVELVQKRLRLSFA